jgi:Reverse transcriptase (RNA-dependent DNA polymerase)
MVRNLQLVSPDWTADLIFKHGHLFIAHAPAVGDNFRDSLYSNSDLSTIHRKLGHAPLEATERFLALAQPDEFQGSDRQLLKEILNECVVYEKFGPRPRRLRAVIPANVTFNHEVAIDVYYIHGYPVLSVICLSTSFVASSFLESRHSAAIWDTFMRTWCYSYVGAPSFVRLDAAGEHTSAEFRDPARASGIELVFSLVESHWSLGIGKRVHSRLRNVFQKLHIASPRTSYATKLKATDFAFNSCPPRHGAPPGLLVFSQVSRLPCADIAAAPALKNDERLGLMAVARAEAEVQHARLRYKELNRRASPTECDTLSPGDLCLVFRDSGDFVHQKPGFTGPFIFLYRQGSIAFVLDGSDVRKFAVSHVKPATASEKIREDARASLVAAEKSLSPATEPLTLPTESLGHPAAPGPASLLDRSPLESIHSNILIDSLLVSALADYNPLLTQGSNSAACHDSPHLECSHSFESVPSIHASINAAVQVRIGNDLTVGTDVWVTEIITPTHSGYKAITEEIQCLLDRGTFLLVLADDVPKGANILGSRIVLALKNFDTIDESMKARLVRQGCGDREGPKIVREAPTVAHFTVRLLISISVLMGWMLWSKDARQAFLQSRSGLSRRIYARLPKELRSCFRGFLLLLLKPLYGLKESGSYWHNTYTTSFLHRLGMTHVFLDPCLFIRHFSDILDGLAALLVDDTLMTGTSHLQRPSQTCTSNSTWDPLKSCQLNLRSSTVVSSFLPNLTSSPSASRSTYWP